MRDLDIRGVGNVLGKEQHGSMEKVGYYLYCRLLENALKEIKGEKLEFKKEIKLDINLNAYISEEYIESETDRIKKYSQISGLDSMQELESLKSDIQKTYGTVPAELENLMLIALMKNLAVKENIQRVLITQKLCRLFVYKSEEIISEKLSEKLKNNSYVSLIFEKQPILSFNNETEKIKKKITDVINFLI
jgi:transcription-repair coupling factor (superfamily II helicase)